MTMNQKMTSLKNEVKLIGNWSTTEQSSIENDMSDDKISLLMCVIIWRFREVGRRIHH